MLICGAASTVSSLACDRSFRENVHQSSTVRVSLLSLVTDGNGITVLGTYSAWRKNKLAKVKDK
jgi:hypothetical protein